MSRKRLPRTKFKKILVVESLPHLLIKLVSLSNSLKIAVGAVICDESILKGDITIGAKTVVHPRASIIAEAGPIFIGEGNIIEEMATIINRLPPGTKESDAVQTQIIGNYNVFEIDSMCEGLRIGDNNILETKGNFMLIF